MLSGDKLPGYRFPLAVIGYAVWLYHRFAISYRDAEELLLERGIAVPASPSAAGALTSVTSSRKLHLAQDNE